MLHRVSAAAFIVLTFTTVLPAQTLPLTQTLPPAVPASPVIAPPTTSAPASADLAGRSSEPLPSFGSLFKDLGRDFTRLPSVENGLILGVAGALSVGVHENDPAITRSAHASQGLDTLFESGAALGSGYAQIGAAFATFAIGHAMHSSSVSVLGADLVRAQLMTAVITQGLKFAVDRARPDGSRYSFPSGHTSASFATASVLQRHYGWKVGIPAYALAAYVGGSRMQENRHYLSDVIFGAAVGVVAGRTATINVAGTRFAMSPIAAPGGGGVGIGFTRVTPAAPTH